LFNTCNLIAVLVGVRYVKRPVTFIQQGSCCTSFDREPLYVIAFSGMFAFYDTPDLRAPLKLQETELYGHCQAMSSLLHKASVVVSATYDYSLMVHPNY
jgi:hypothetical protein